MQRLIDADAIEYTHITATRTFEDGHKWYELCATYDEIADMPTIDAEPVKHAKLLNAHPYGECSNCGYLIDIREEFNYCPNCGCRMDGE